MYKKFQRDVLVDLNERVFKTDKKYTLGKVLDADAFNKYLNGGGGERGYRAALKEVFGDEYVKNLDILNKALQISSRSAASAQQGVVGSAFTDIIRARVGQFTLAGRLFTAGRRIFTAASNRMIARALLNPDSLKDLIALRTLSKTSKAAAVILAKLGGSIFMVQDDRPTPPPKEAIIEQETPDVSMLFEDIVNPEGTVIGSRRVLEPTASIIPVTPPINTGIMQVASTPLSQTGLTQTEQALLSPEEQSIRLRQRGMA